MSELSRKTGLNRESLYKTLLSNGNPRFSTVLKVSKALGLNFQIKAAGIITRVFFMNGQTFEKSYGVKFSL